MTCAHIALSLFAISVCEQILNKRINNEITYLRLSLKTLMEKDKKIPVHNNGDPSAPSSIFIGFYSQEYFSLLRHSFIRSNEKIKRIKNTTVCLEYNIYFKQFIAFWKAIFLSKNVEAVKAK